MLTYTNIRRSMSSEMAPPFFRNGTLNSPFQDFRRAIGRAIAASITSGNSTALADSDTIWPPALLAFGYAEWPSELQMNRAGSWPPPLG